MNLKQHEKRLKEEKIKTDKLKKEATNHVTNHALPQLLKSDLSIP